MNRLVINNFRHIESVDISFGEFTILIGDNGSGKTTISQISYLIKKTLNENLNYLIINAFQENNNFNEFLKSLSAKLSKEILDEFVKYFGMFLFEDLFTSQGEIYFEIGFIKISLSNKKRTDRIFADCVTVEFDWDNTLEDWFLDLKASENVELVLSISGTADRFMKTERVKYFPDSRSVFHKFHGVFSNWFLSEGAKHSLPELPQRNFEITKDYSFWLSTLDSYFRQNKLEGFHFLDRFSNLPLMPEVLENRKNNHEEWTKFFNSRVKVILNADYERRNDTEYLVANNGKLVDLSEGSSGQQEVIGILKDLYYLFATTTESPKSDFRFYEEPESHLFLDGQNELIQLLFYLAEEDRRSFLLTTHSSNVLSSFNNILFGVKLYSKISQIDSIDRSLYLNDLINAFNLREFNNKQIRHFFTSVKKAQCYQLKEGGYGIVSELIIDAQSNLIKSNAMDNILESQNKQFFELNNLNARLHKI